MTRRSGQVLVFFALVLPIVLLPVAAYAVDASVAASAYSRLVEVTARAAEDAAQQIDVQALRSGAGLKIDVPAAMRAARDDITADATAKVVAVAVAGDAVTVTTGADVTLPLVFVGPPSLTLHATATARIAAGYDSPSSRLPLPTSTFSSDASGISSWASSSRHLSGCMNG